MATVRQIGTRALTDIGVLEAGETMTSEQAATVLYLFQDQLDAWQADKLTLSVQSYQEITWPSGTSTQTIGPTGADITAQRPVWINGMNYDNPGSSPVIEVPMGMMDQDAYRNLSIKELQSGLPTQFFYQTSIDTTYGTIFIWPKPTQQMTLRLYAPQAVDVPVALTSVVIGPPGYAEVFRYQLDLRLIGPMGVQAPEWLVGPMGMAARSFTAMKKPNVQPAILGIDAALVPNMGAGYNVYSDTTSASGNN